MRRAVERALNWIEGGVGYIEILMCRGGRGPLLEKQSLHVKVPNYLKGELKFTGFVCQEWYR